MTPSNHTEENIERRLQIEYINRRVFAEYHWLNYWGDHSFKYLLFVNAGGVIAILTFISTFKVKAISVAGLSLGSFVIGLVLVGLLCKYLYYFFKVKCTELDNDRKRFDTRQLTFEEFLIRDAPRLDESRYGEKLALAASWFAFGGILLGLISFFVREELMSISIKEILMILSGASYLAGTILLALAIEFRHEKMKGDKSPVVQAASVIGSPGIRNMTKHIWGMILSALGYALLVASLVARG